MPQKPWAELEPIYKKLLSVKKNGGTIDVQFGTQLVKATIRSVTDHESRTFKHHGTFYTYGIYLRLYVATSEDTINQMSKDLYTLPTRDNPYAQSVAIIVLGERWELTMLEYYKSEISDYSWEFAVRIFAK